jgi:iron-sulfur cluster assembly protein
MIQTIPVTITSAAQQEVQKSLSIKGIPPDYHLRIGLRGGACSATYLLGFDKQSEHDDVFIQDSFKVLIDRRHLMYLIGLTLDFQEEGNGFTFVKN